MKGTRTSLSFAVAVAPKNWMNWKKMEIARTPVGGEGGTARRSVARRTVPVGKNGTAQRNVRDPFVRLSINEGDETG